VAEKLGENDCGDPGEMWAGRRGRIFFFFFIRREDAARQTAIRAGPKGRAPDSGEFPVGIGG